MTQEQKNHRFANALADNAAQALAARELRIPGVIDTMDEIEFDWHYRYDREGALTRSTVVITDEIRAEAKRFLAEWTA